MQQHTGTFVWDSPCKCFRVAAQVSLTDCGELSSRVTLDLARLAQPRAAR